MMGRKLADRLVTLILMMVLSGASNAAMDMCLLTDMSYDVDDLGALQVALYYHHTNRIDLRCVISGTSGSQNHRAMRHIIEWWGYGIEQIKIGTNESGNGRGFLGDFRWVNAFNSKYDTPLFTPLNGAALLNDMLAAHPAMRVVEVGPAMTVYNANARARVTRYYQMGGRYPSGAEGNLRSFIVGARYIADTGSTEWYDDLLGRAVVTGQSFIFPQESPVKFGYETHSGGRGRESWDLLTVLGAIDPSWFTYQTGTNSVSTVGINSWSASGKRHRMAFHKDPTAVRDHLNSILAKVPAEVASGRRGRGIVPVLQLLLPDR